MSQYETDDSVYLWNVDAGPEELQVLPHLLRLEFGIEYGQLCEHAHVGTLQTEGGLQHSDQLLKVTTVLGDINGGVENEKRKQVEQATRKLILAELSNIRAQIYGTCPNTLVT